jgi:hypothetical protein
MNNMSLFLIKLRQIIKKESNTKYNNEIYVKTTTKFDLSFKLINIKNINPIMENTNLSVFSNEICNLKYRMEDKRM